MTDCTTVGSFTTTKVEDAFVTCHGCGGKGWVDSEVAKGPAKCPVCMGAGKAVARFGGNMKPEIISYTI